MSEYLELNLEIFFKRFPNYAKLWNRDVCEAVSSSYEVRGEGDSVALFEKGKLVDAGSLDFQISTYSVEKSAKRVLLVEGFGLGFGLQSILESSLKNFDNLIVVEPSRERFLFALGQLSFEAILKNEKIHFIVGETSEAIFSHFLQVLRVPEIAFRMDASEIIHHPVFSDRYRRYFEAVWDEWKAAKTQIRLHFGHIEDSLIGLKYVVENLDWIRRTPGVSGLKDQFKGLPAVIVSTGPSLNRSLEELRKVQDRAILLSADASLNILLENGIEPHFVLSLERDLFSKKFFQRSSKAKSKLRTQLISYPFVPQASLVTYQGPQWVAYRDLGYFLYLEHELPRGILSSSTSVAHFCLRLASYMGCSTVALVGQDLSFDPDRLSSHAEGIAYEEWAKESSMDHLLKRIKDEKLGQLLWVDGNFKERVPTHSVYFSFMKEFSWESSQLPLKIFNCTEGGAKIPGIEWRKLVEVSCDWQAIHEPFDKIDKLREIRTGEASLLPDVSQFLSELSQKFEMILSLSKDLESAKTLGDEKRRQTIEVLRSAQVELYKDTRFVCFVVQNAGHELVQIENAWAVLPEAASFDSKMELLKQWTETVKRVTDGVSELLTRAASEKKFEALSL